MRPGLVLLLATGIGLASMGAQAEPLVDNLAPGTWVAYDVTLDGGHSWFNWSMDGGRGAAISSIGQIKYDDDGGIDLFIVQFTGGEPEIAARTTTNGIDGVTGTDTSFRQTVGEPGGPPHGVSEYWGFGHLRLLQFYAGEFSTAHQSVTTSGSAQVHILQQGGGAFVADTRNFDGAMEAQAHPSFAANLHAAVLGHFDINSQGPLVGGFWAQGMGLKPVMSSSRGERECPCVFVDLVGPNALGPDQYSFRATQLEERHNLGGGVILSGVALPQGFSL